MAEGASFGKQPLSLEEITSYEEDIEAALYAYFTPMALRSVKKFIGYTPQELNDALTERILETELRSSLAMLTMLEARFRQDYQERGRFRKKGSLSRELSRKFRDLYSAKGESARLEDEIFDLWAEVTPSTKKAIGELRSAFKFRHWLAHGRYWEPKLGRKWSLLSVQELTEVVLTDFPFI